MEIVGIFIVTVVDAVDFVFGVIGVVISNISINKVVECILVIICIKN